jgi:hypothetical protein
MRNTPLAIDPTFEVAIRALSSARGSFEKAVEEQPILGNDNHIGDIGEYWVRKFFERDGAFKCYPEKKNAPYDLELKDSTRVSVKTITDWSKTKAGTQVKPLCGRDWSVLAAVYLDRQLFARKIALVPLEKLTSHHPLVGNAQRRVTGGSSAYPRFAWWPWLDTYLAYEHK